MVDFAIKVGNPEKQRGACMVVGVYESRKLSSSAKVLDKISQGHIKNLLATGDMEGKAGTYLLWPHSFICSPGDKLQIQICQQQHEVHVCFAGI